MPEIPPAFLAQAKISDQEARVRIDRHLKQIKHPLTGSGLQFKHLYYPYWKVDAVILKLRNKIERRELVLNNDGQTEVGFDHQKTEINLAPYRVTVAAGRTIAGIPEAIGLRADYLKLTAYSRDNTQDDFYSVPVTINWSQVWDSIQNHVRGLGEMDIADFGANRTELFRPIGSLIYFPFLLAESYDGGDYNRYIVDGVTGRVLEHLEDPPEADNLDEPPSLVEFGQLGVDFHRCGNCGCDLPSRQSYVYICDNCHEMTVLDGHAREVQHITRVAANLDDNDSLFPFWSLQVGPEDHQRLRRLFGGIYNSDRLVIPAFRLGSFEASYRLSKRMSAAQPQLEFDAVDGFDPRFRPVDISLAEAQLMAQVMIYRAELTRGVTGSVKPEDFQPLTCELFFAPFHPESYFFVDSVLQSVTFEKNVVD